MDDTGGNLGMWGTIGAAVAAAITGVLAWVTGRQRRQAEQYGYGTDIAGYQAEKDIIDNLRAEVARLSERVTKLEAEGMRMRNRIFHLEDEMRKNNLPIPPERGIEGAL